MVEEVQVRSKEKKFRGKSLAELQSLDVRESSKFLKARSRRSVLRNFDVIENFVKSCDKKIARKKRIRTQMRDIVIVPSMVGMTIGIYNGKSYLDTNITIEMIGHRLGEFSPTRVRAVHTSVGVGATKGSRAKKK
jgi:small subunit ribosomal protein S19